MYISVCVCVCVYPGADAAAAGGDLEVSVEVPDGAAGEEALHHQQHAVHQEGRGHAVDHILQDVDPGAHPRINNTALDHIHVSITHPHINNTGLDHIHISITQH